MCWWQVNIFLAILIEGYEGVVEFYTKQEELSSGSEDLLSELVAILTHEARRLIKFVFKVLEKRRVSQSSIVALRNPMASFNQTIERLGEGERHHKACSERRTLTLNSAQPQGHSFISDEEILSRLSQTCRTASEDDARALFAASNSMASITECIKTESGFEMGAEGLYDMLSQYFPEMFPQLTDSEAANKDSTDVYLNTMFIDVLFRYGRPTEIPTLKETMEERAKAFRDAMQMRTMCRVARAELFALQETARFQEVVFEAAHQGTTWIRSMVLSVQIKAARNLPRMDVLRGVEAYCLTFLEDAPGLNQSEIRPGDNESGWAWDSACYQWTIPDDPNVLRRDRLVVIMMYDKDQLTEDDLIGCVTVPMGEAFEAPYEAWCPIKLAPGATKLEVLSRGCGGGLQEPGAPPELLLRLSLAESEPAAGSSEPEQPAAADPATAYGDPASAKPLVDSDSWASGDDPTSNGHSNGHAPIGAAAAVGSRPAPFFASPRDGPVYSSGLPAQLWPEHQRLNIYGNMAYY